MPARLLKVDDLRDLTSPDKIAKIFEQLGYNASSEPIDVEGLQLSARSAEAIAALVKLEKQYFDVNSEARQGLRLEILEAEKQVFAGAIADQRNVVIEQQKHLEREIRQLNKPQKKQLQEREILSARLAGLDGFEAQVNRGDRSLNFFQCRGLGSRNRRSSRSTVQLTPPEINLIKGD